MRAWFLVACGSLLKVIRVSEFPGYNDADLNNEKKAERIVVIKSVTELADQLTNGWRFDPWLSPKGLPTIIGEDAGWYWILVKGTDEDIQNLNPFIELPEEEVELPQSPPVGYATIYLEHTKDEPTVPEGYVILHKDHIYSKGTVYTRVTPLQPEEQQQSEDPTPT